MLLRKFSIIALVAIAVGGFSALTSSDANAQATDTESATATVTIDNPIVLTNTGPLDFGSAAPSIAASTITIDETTGAQSGSAIGMAGPSSAAGFTVTGVASQAISVTVPADGVVFLTGGPGADMGVNTFAHDAPATLDGTGNASFGVGATLTIGAGQLAGTYSDTFDVIVSYQ